MDKQPESKPGIEGAVSEHPRSHFFTVRLWRETLGEGEVELRARIQHVASGEVLYLRNWADLPGLFLIMIGAEPSPGDKPR